MMVFRMPRSSHALCADSWPLPGRVVHSHARARPGQCPGIDRRLKPAAGLEATLWAAEPMIMNPTNIDIDSRGRVWVTEGLNYRLTRGGNARFQRVDDSDKIKILEDTDGDGKADKMIVFADRIFPVPDGHRRRGAPR